MAGSGLDLAGRALLRYVPFSTGQKPAQQGVRTVSAIFRASTGRQYGTGTGGGRTGRDGGRHGVRPRTERGPGGGTSAKSNPDYGSVDAYVP